MSLLEIVLEIRRALRGSGLTVPRLSALVGVALLAGACVYDDDARCGPNQLLVENDSCECAPGFVLVDGQCQGCGEHEVERNGACKCEEGYARADETEACLPKPSGLGDACDTEESTCGTSQYPECHAVDGTSGYCTNRCESTQDCSGGFRCQTAAGGSFCRRPATGYGDKCETSADCEGKEAAFCETLQTHLCVVPCTATGDECFDNEVCCDLTAFGGSLICVPDGKCPTQGGG